mgnify:CR=1 FL=1
MSVVRLDGAIIKEQGVTFAVVAVKSHINSPQARQKAQEAFRRFFPGIPIILMRNLPRGKAEFWGRSDIVRFLSGFPWDLLPWKRFTFTI